MFQVVTEFHLDPWSKVIGYYVLLNDFDKVFILNVCFLKTLITMNMISVFLFLSLIISS